MTDWTMGFLLYISLTLTWIFWYIASIRTDLRKTDYAVRNSIRCSTDRIEWVLHGQRGEEK